MGLPEQMELVWFPSVPQSALLSSPAPDATGNAGAALCGADLCRIFQELGPETLLGGGPGGDLCPVCDREECAQVETQDVAAEPQTPSRDNHKRGTGAGERGAGQAETNGTRWAGGEGQFLAAVRVTDRYSRASLVLRLWTFTPWNQGWGLAFSASSMALRNFSTAGTEGCFKASELA